MDITQIHPELRKAARKLPPIPVHHYWLLKIMRLITPLFFHNVPLDGVSIRDVQLTHKKIRIYIPENGLSGAGVLWMHGGGLIMGDVRQDDLICSRYARELNAVVVSVGYRVAPEYPHPAGSDDCFEAWQWLLNNADDLGVDSTRIAIAGQSGGGARAALLAQRILDHGGVQPAAQFLFCPMLDDRTAARRELDAVRHKGWTNKNNCAAWSWYLGCEAGSDDVPDHAVPARREDLSGLPPTWLGIGTADLFYEESKVYAERLQHCGVHTVFDVVPQAFHGFEAIAPDTKVAQEYFARHFEHARSALRVDAAAQAPKDLLK